MPKSRILIIDDEAAIRDSLKMTLEYEGYEVIGAATGQEGIALVEREVPVAWAGHPIDELDIPGTARVISLSRLGVGAVPAQGLLCQEGDVVYVGVSGDAVDAYDQHLAGPKAGGH